MDWLRECGRHGRLRLTGMLVAALALLHAAPAAANGLRTLSDDALRQTAASGFPDRLFDGVSRYMVNGNAVEVFGDTATLLNPLWLLTGADGAFRNALFSAANPAIIVDRNGTGLVRIDGPGGLENFDVVPARSATGASMGRVAVRGLDRRGTVVVVMPRHGK